MGLTVTHSFVSQNGDGVDPSEVGETAWNAPHSLQVAAAGLLGADAAGPVGAVEVGAGLSLSDGVLAVPGSYDPSDVGYDIVLVAGDSTIYNGHSLDPTLDVSNARVFQYPNASYGSTPADTISPAFEPLNFNGVPSVGPPPLISMALAFCRRLVGSRPLNRSLLIVPQALSGSAFASGGWVSRLSTAQSVIWCSGGGAVGDTIVVNGVTITIVASGATGNQINFSSNPVTLIGNLLTFVNAHTGALLVNAVATGAVATFGSIVGGTNYVNGSYTNVPLVGGQGAGATANITVSGGAVTACVLQIPGNNGYAVGDSLTASPNTLGGNNPGTVGAGFTVAVASIGASSQILFLANTAGAAGGTITLMSTRVGSFASFYCAADGIGGGYVATQITMAGGADSGGGVLFKNAVTQANLAIAAGANNRILCIVQGLGTNESESSGAQFQHLLTNQISDFRSSITGATGVPFVAMPMVPEWVQSFSLLGPIDRVLRNIANLSPYCGYTISALGSADPVPFHPDAPTLRINGWRAVDAYNEALSSKTSSGPGQDAFTQVSVIGGVQSTGLGTGDLVVAGGGSVGGNLYIGGSLFSQDFTFPATDTGGSGWSVGIGNGALSNLPPSAAYGAIAIGGDAMSSAGMTTSAINDIGIGSQTLISLTTAAQAIAIGTQSQQDNTAASRCIGIGYQTLLVNQISTDNIVIGASAARQMIGTSTAGFIIAIGTTTLFDLTTGYGHIAVGYNTGRGIVTGIYDTIIGGNVTGLPSGLSNAIILADGAGNIGMDYNLTSASFWTIKPLKTTASAASRAGINLPPGSAPTSPLDGDFWYDGTNLKFQVGASTKTVTLT